jgi:hypothetical protein
MLHKMAKLSKMRESMRAGSQLLIAEIENNPDSDHALQCLRMIAECRNLENDLSHFATTLLASQEPAGTG